jgi:hypothetical protein
MRTATKKLVFHKTVLRPTRIFRKRSADAQISDHKLPSIRIDKLREAIRNNKVSFPSQVPLFPKHTRPDVQQKLVQLYFIVGWSRDKIRARYGLSRVRFQQILSTWTKRAIEMGYIQTIPPEQSFLLPRRLTPIRATLSCVVNGWSDQVAALSAREFMDASSKGPGTKPQPSFRPRRSCDAREIANILKELQSGRTLAEMADKAGVSPCTVRGWRKNHEIWQLRSENTELKERLATAGAIEKTDSSHRNYQS